VDLLFVLAAFHNVDQVRRRKGAGNNDVDLLFAFLVFGNAVRRRKKNG